MPADAQRAPAPHLEADWAGPFTAAISRILAGSNAPRLVKLYRIDPAQGATQPQPIMGPLAERLKAQGITTLRLHQAEALTAARAGEHFVLASPTASGKSLCYMLPLAETLLSDWTATALYISPAKALAQQQLQRLQDLVPEIPSSLYDGDTPKESRREVRTTARCIYTNPDMLHVGILPYHAGWSRFFANLRFVVLDEAHLYTGVFGSHTVHILRRLRTLCRHYGSNPTFILLSATTGNPQAHAEALVGQPVRLIRGTATGLGTRYVAIIDTSEGRASLSQEAVNLLATLVDSGFKALLFAQSRQGVDALTRGAIEAASGHRIGSYRSGYLPEERRALEADLFSGRMEGMIATKALELGIDVGALDAVILSGFPGSVSSMWQQLGRAGRSQKLSLAAILLGTSPPDRHFALHPDDLMRRSVEKAVVNPDNPYIQRCHGDAASWEAPGQRSRGSSPAFSFGIRGAGERRRLLCNGRLVEETDAIHALIECYPGAVYMSRNRTYICKGWDGNDILLREVSGIDYTTTPLMTVDVHLLNAPAASLLPMGHGRAQVSTTVSGFRRLALRDRAPLGSADLSLPPYVIETDALWLCPPTADNGVPIATTGALHAVEHLLAAMMPTVVLADFRDIQGASFPSHPDVGNRPALFLYDEVPGGVGFCTAAFEAMKELLTAAKDAVE